MIKPNQVYIGTWGEVWINGKLFSEISAFQAKVEFKKDTFHVLGNMAEQHKITGWSGKGSITMKHIDDSVAKMLLPILKEGLEPEITIITKQENKTSNATTERIAFKEVSFDDITLFDFESGEVDERECPFTFSDLDEL